MPARPRIAISTEQLPDALSTAPLNGTSRVYAEAVAAVGGLPLLLPVLPEQAADYAAQADAVLLTGGHDVQPQCYGAQPRRGLGEVDEQRDRFETALYRAARALGRPVWAICRGVQLMNVLEGGTLHQHLPDVEEYWLDHAQLTRSPALGHAVDLAPGSRLARHHGERSDVNSYHHQAIDRLAPSLRAVATAPDGVIEAVEGDGLIGVQWHPELLYPVHPQGLQTFRAFMTLLEG
jgi:putative glutamine amidotransferase